MVEWMSKSIETLENKEVSDSSRECILFDDVQSLRIPLTKIRSLDDLFFLQVLVNCHGLTLVC